ncbi:hypothetical protein [Wenzhou picorna-like virus 22]|uniref:hypothetical protein n=1 Tax=Wenzhou picorna-like virus 22 TaxID=1923607 RepID=UPI00090A0E3A|nr:hypothetical protein [Wenzhou picorna-like virus 22]APG78507.1 hypothetical protein [Wenzhou picorna-like virus 22]
MPSDYLHVQFKMEKLFNTNTTLENQVEPTVNGRNDVYEVSEVSDTIINSLYDLDISVPKATEVDMDYYEVFELPRVYVSERAKKKIEKNFEGLDVDLSNVIVVRDDIKVKKNKERVPHTVVREKYSHVTYVKKDPGDMKQSIVQDGTTGITSEKKKHWNRARINKKVKAVAQMMRGSPLNVSHTTRRQLETSFPEMNWDEETYVSYDDDDDEPTLWESIDSTFFEFVETAGHSRLVKQYGALFTRLASYILSIIRSKNWVEIVLHSVSYISILRGNYDLVIFDDFSFLVSWIKREFSLCMGKWKNKGVTQSASAIFRNMASILDSAFITSIKRLVLLIASCGYLPQRAETQLFRFFGKTECRSGDQLFIEICKNMSEVLNHIDLFRTGMPFTDVLLSKSPIHSIETSTQWLVSYENLTISTHFNDNRPSNEPMISDVEYEVKLNETFANILTVKKTNGPFLSYINSARLQECEVTLRNIIKGRVARDAKYRTAPLGLYLVGPPGVGKSTLVQFIVKVWCECRHIPYSDKLVYRYNASDKYYSGYNSRENPVMHFPEIGSLAPNMVRTSGDPTLQALLDLISPTPFPCNSAAIEDKGKVFANPALVIADGNNPDMNANHILYSAAAAYRRFDFILVNPKDPSKLGQFDISNKEYKFDQYSFTVMRRHPIYYSATDPKPYKEYEERVVELGGKPLKDVDIFELLRFLEHRFVQETNKQHMIDEALKSEGVAKYFQKVFAPTTSVPDTEVKEQTGVTQAFSIFKEIKEIETGYSKLLIRVSNLVTVGVCSLLFSFGSAFYFALPLSFVPGIFLFPGILWNYRRTLARLPQRFLTSGPTWFLIVRWYAICCINLLFDTISFCFALISYRVCRFGLWMVPDHIFGKYMKRTILSPINESVDESRQTIYKRLYCLFGYDVFETGEYKTKLGQVFMTMAMLYTAYCVYKRATRPSKNVSQSRTDVREFVGLTREPVVKKDVGGHFWSLNVPLPEINPRAAAQKNEFRNVLNSVRNNVRQIAVMGRENPIEPAQVEVIKRLFSEAAADASIMDRMRIQIQYAWGLRGDVYVTNAHVFDPACRYFVIRAHIPGNPTSCTYNLVDRYYNMLDVGNDVCLVRLTNTHCVDVTSYLPTEKMLIYNTVWIGRFVSNSTYQYYDQTIQIVRQELRLEMENAWDPPNDKTWVSNPISYRMTLPQDSTTDGMCGTPIVAQINGFNVIVGFHCGAKSTVSRECFATVIWRELIEAKFHDWISKGPVMTISSKSQSLNPIPPRFNITTRVVSHHCLRYVSTPGLEVLCAVDGYDARQNRSLVERTRDYWMEGKNCVDTLIPYHSYDSGKERYGPPVFKHVSVDQGDGTVKWLHPNKYFVEAVGEIKIPLPMEDMGIVTHATFNYILKRLDMLNGKRIQIKPWSLDQAINGIIGNPYARGMNMSTSAGFYFGKVKRNLVTQINEGGVLKYVVSDVVIDRTNEILECLSRGESVGTVITCALKDEIRSRSKIESAKTRVFCVGDMSMLILSRMFFGPLFTLMQEFSEAFGCAIGINTHTDSDMLARRLNEFSSLFMAGDYSEYDTRMSPGITLVASTVIYRLLRAMGYDDKDMIVVQSLLTDSYFPQYILEGVVFSSVGSTPSGEYGTAERNSLKGLVILIYAYLKLKPKEVDLESFGVNVLPVTYGDDLVAAVRPHVSNWFNNVSFAKIVKDLGMTYTDPNKKLNLSPFFTFSEITFLKRRFIFANNKYHMPLEWDSIGKSLSYIIPSKYVGYYEQRMSSLLSAVYEVRIHARTTVALHGRSVCKEGTNYGNLVFCEYKRRFRYLASLCSLDDGGKLIKQVIDNPAVTKLFPLYNDSESGVVQSNLTIDSALFDPNMSSNISNLSTESGHSNQTDQSVRPRSGRRVSEVNFENTLRDLGFYRAHSPLFVNTNIDSTQKVVQAKCQSTGGVITEERNETRTALDVVESSVGKASIDHDENDVLTIARFFERPFTMYDFNYAVGGTMRYDFDIFDLWSKTPEIRRKLCNFMYFRGDLNIRVTISSTPFHYGHVILAYVPYARLNDPLVGIQNGSATQQEMLVAYLSQGPYTHIANMCEGGVYEFKIPFTSPSSYYRIYRDNTQVITATQEFSDFLEAGKLFIVGFNPVSTASDDYTTPVSVNIQAFCTNVHMHTPTRTLMAISQSRRAHKVKSRQVSEYQRPPTVSQMASNVAEAAGLLSTIPPLIPFMKPVEYISSKFAEVAAIFGWSKPLQLEATNKMKNMNYSNQATCIGVDTSEVLAVDPKCGLVTSETPQFSDEDQMTIRYLCSREGYIYTATWTKDTAVGSGSLFMSYVNPSMAFTPTGTLVTALPTPLMFATRPFRYWRGSITFIFRIAGAKFQAGRLAVIFEPNISQESLINASAIQMGTTNAATIDIAEVKEFEFTVDWNSAYEWCTIPSQRANFAFNTGGQTLNTSKMWFSMGYVRLVPLTALITSGTAPVYINVFVKSNDMQVAYPTKTYPGSRILKTVTQSLHVPGTKNMPSTTTRWFGESVVSFRTLLKRYETVARGISVEPNNNGAVIFQVIHPLYPLQTLPSVITPETQTFNGLTSLFSYLRAAYLGMNGGSRYHYRSWRNAHVEKTSGESVTRSTINNRGDTTVMVTRAIPTSDVPYGGSIPSVFTDATWSVSAFNQSSVQINADIGGSIAFDLLTNAGVEFQIPSYFPANFLFANNVTNGARKPLDRLTADLPVGDGMTIPPGYTNFLLREFTPGQFHGGGKENQWVLDWSAAEDFSFYLFLGAPAYNTLE